MSHIRPALGPLAAIALLAAGCGGSSSSGGGAPKAKASTMKSTVSQIAQPAKTDGPLPSKAEYVQRADSICREARALSLRANAAVEKAFAAKQTSAAADAIDHYGPLYARKILKLERLPRPAGQDKVLTTLLKVMDSQALALGTESGALRKGDTTTVQRLGVVQSQAVQIAEQLGKKYGFKVCGRIK